MEHLLRYQLYTSPKYCKFSSTFKLSIKCYVEIGLYKRSITWLESYLK